MLNLEEAAGCFAAVGSEPRLQVLQTLVKAGDQGLTIGEIQQRLELPASTLAHHLKFLSTAGLIVQIKSGRSVINRADYQRMDALVAFLLHECCSEAPIKRGDL